MKTLKNALASMILLMIFFGSLEIITGTYYALRLKNFVLPTELTSLILGQNWDGKVSKKSCSYLETLGPHPIFGYSVHVDVLKNCDGLGPTTLNNRGLSGPDYPWKKNPDVFVILVTGGSVADQLGTAMHDGKHFLTEYFNTNFFPPHGKRFQVIFSALGDYRTPVNAFSMMENSEIIDAVIDISGYNESHNHRYPHRFGKPGNNYWHQFELESRHEDFERRKKVFHLAKWLENSVCRFSYTCTLMIETRIKMIMNSSKKTGRAARQEILFSYQNKLTESEAKEVNLMKHKNYYRIMKATCGELKLKCAFFLQPIPQISKPLSKEEKIIVNNLNKTDPVFPELYQWMTDELMKLSGEGVPIYSLLDVFRNERSTIYVDHIHYLWYQGRPIHPGYEIILQSMKKTLNKHWNLKEK